MGMADPKGFDEYLQKAKKHFENLRPSYKNKIMSKYNAEYCEAKGLIRRHMGWPREVAMHWMKQDNPLLGGVSPQFMIAYGRGKKLIEWIVQQINDKKEADAKE